MRYALMMLLMFAAVFAQAQETNPASSTNLANPAVRTLIVIFDGLRPDYITPQYMPNVYALKHKGSYVAKNHSVFPTVTRVNASSYATGSYPATHGLLGNTVYFPQVDKRAGLNTGEANELMRINRATNDRLLTAVSLGEILKASGSSMMVFSSGSSGQAFLQNHTISGGGVVHPELILPASLKEDVMSTVGPPPASAKPNIPQHDWATRAFLQYGLAEDGPLVSAVWFSDPDGSAHSYGIGSPQAMESIKAVDEQFGYIVRTLESRNLIGQFNIIVTADHGFATQKGKVSIQEFLIERRLKKSADSEDVILAGNAIYVREGDRNVVKEIVSVLQSQPWVGAIFTKSQDGSAKGWVDGTLSFNVIHWDHDRSADILVDYNWDDEPNELGYKGSSYAKGVAGHGGSSPYEVTIPLIASGPAFKSGFESALPSSNIDIVPTLLHFYEIDIPTSMDGRVLEELLAVHRGGKGPSSKMQTLEASTKLEDGLTYRVVLQRTLVGRQQYVDFTKVYRKQAR